MCSMTYTERAIELLRTTDDALRVLMAEALEAHDYREIAGLAAIAEALAATWRQTTSRLDAASSAQPVVANDSRVGSAILRAGPRSHSSRRTFKKISPVPAKTKNLANGGAFPRFEREADRLVKIGWSKQDGRAYEHRAPKEIVVRFAESLGAKSDGNAVTMDDLLPLRDASGKELPSYQAYLALAWLRSEGVVQRVGKDGYAIKPETLSAKSLEALWNTLPAR
jgi:hypothetical protein